MSAIRGWICMLLNLVLVNMQSITVRGEPCQAKTLFASELHYFAEQCTKELHAHIARNFIGLVTQHLDIIRVSCSPGYFLDITGCQACAVDQYQDQEAQTSCVPCPPGTSTLGQVASKRPEDCRGKSCPVLQQPIYGSITSLSCGSSFGSQATLTCDAGYKMAGSSLRSCGADGTWSGNVTTCNIIKCPSIKAPSHGMVFPNTCQIPSGVNNKTECFFACNVTVGYQLESAPKVVCLENGSWSADTTKTICRGTASGTSTKMILTYSLIHHFITGDSFGQGESQLIANRCPDLPTPLNGAKTCDKSPDEMSCILHCHAGYDFANDQPQLYLCNPITGTWVPSSKLLDCSGTHHPKVLLAFELL